MSLAWIHLENLKFFLYLGATKEEQSLGQNITLNLSLCIPYTNTDDKIENTVDYGAVYQFISEKIRSLNGVRLLEYFVEQLLEEIHTQFPKIKAAKIMVQKGYVPLKNFSGTSKIEVERKY